MKDISFLKDIPIAHRGLHDGNVLGGDIPENSKKAFERAIERGYTIEMDVRLSKDNKIIVFHDDDLVRMTGVNGKVVDYTYEELQNFSLNKTEEKIMLFCDFLKLVDGKVPLLIELKDMPKKRGFVKMVYEELKGYNGKFAIQSFNPLYVRKIKKLDKTILRGQLATLIVPSNISWFNSMVISKMLLNFITKPDFISFDIRGLPYKKARRKNTLLLGWTIRTEEDYKKAVKYVDNIIFEHINPREI